MKENHRSGAGEPVAQCGGFFYFLVFIGCKAPAACYNAAMKKRPRGRPVLNKTNQLHIRLTPQDRKVLDDAAKADSRSTSHWVLLAALEKARSKR